MKVNFIVDMEKNLQGSGIYSSAKRLQQHLIEEGIDVEINGKKSRYDIYHFHTATPSSLLRAKILQKKRNQAKKEFSEHDWKLIVHGHTTVEDFQNSFFLSNQISPLVKKHLKVFYQHFDHIIAVSNHNKKLITKLGIESAKISVISNGIDLNKFSNWDEETTRRIRGKILASFNKNEDSFIIICVGIGFYRKGIDTFVEVGSRLPQHLFFWIGHQYPIAFLAQQRIIKNARQRARMLPNVSITGYISRKTLDSLLNTADIFLYPTREENQGIALLEAMAFGKAPIVRNHPVFDWLKDGIDCLKGKNTEDFVQHINELSSNRKKLKEIQNNAKISVKNHDISKTIQKLIELYDSLIQNS